MDTSLPLISVIIPIYNSEKYLQKCIASITAQTYNNLDIILVNDGSKDNSLELCKAAHKNDTRISIIDIPNGGVSNARNLGVNKAKGQYIQFIDSDDFVDANYIETLYKNITSANAGMAVCAITSFDISGKKLDHWEVKSNNLDFKAVNTALFLELIQSFLLFGPVNKLYIKSVITNHNIKFDTSLSYGEDLLFNLEYFKHIDSITVTDSIAYKYIHDNANSLSKKAYNDKMEIATRIHFALLDFFKQLEQTNTKAYTVLYNRLFDYYYNNVFAIANASNLNYKTKKEKLLQLLNQSELKTCYKYLISGKYANWIVYLMKFKLASLLLFIIKN